MTDGESPDSVLTASLAAGAPATGTLDTGTTSYWQSFRFDLLGNRASLVEHNTKDATKDVTFTYGYGKTVTGNGTTPSYTAQPHTLSWASTAPAGGGSSYVNDAHGNTTKRDLATTTQDLTWTRENKLATLTESGVTTKYVYDADGNRILENTPPGAS